MKTTSFLTLATAIFSTTSYAFPLFKRDVKLVTTVQEVYETVKVVTTVWLPPGSAAPTATANNGGPSIQAVTSLAAQRTFSFAVPSAPKETSVPTIAAVPPPAPAPTHAPTSAPAAPSPTPSPSSSSSSSPSSGSEQKYSGDITWYQVGEGSCGWESTESQNIVAIPTHLMNNPANPNDNPLCGKTITISYGGKELQAKVVDTCAGCIGDSIDLSEGLFQQFASPSVGRVHGIQWWYN